jgi:DNA polymerase-3 subunit delta
MYGNTSGNNMQSNIITWLKQFTNNKQLSKCLWLHGDNKTIQENAVATIKAIYKSDFAIQTNIVNGNSDWEAVATDLQHVDMFSDKKIIFIRLHTSKIQESIATALTTIVATFSPTQKIILLSDAIDKRQLKAKWLQATMSQIDFIATNQLKAAEQQSWIKFYADSKQLRLEHNSISYLCSLTHGNTDDCKQCLDQLSMLYTNTVITLKNIDTVLSQQSKFQYYELSDALLSGNTQITQTIINRFKNSEHEKILLIWSIKQIITQLHQFQYETNQGKTYKQVLASVWSSKQSLYNAALRRLNYKSLHIILFAILQLDKCVKGIVSADFWNLLETICFSICSGNTKLLEHCHV